MLRASIFFIGFLFFSQQLFAQSCADSVRYWSAQQLGVETNPLANLSYSSALAVSTGAGAFVGSKLTETSALRSEFKEATKYVEKSFAVNEQFSKALSARDKLAFEIESKAGRIGIGGSVPFMDQFKHRLSQSSSTASAGDDFINLYKEKTKGKPQLVLSEQDEKSLKKAVNEHMRLEGEIDKTLKEREALSKSDQYAKFKKFFGNDVMDPLNKKLTNFMATSHLHHALRDNPEERQKRLKTVDSARTELIEEMKRAYKGKIESAKMFAKSKSSVGAVGAATIGTAAGAVIGAATDLAGVNNNCNLGGKADQINALTGYFDSTLSSGQCKPTLNGAYELATMDQKKLEGLCEKVPQLPQILSDAHFRQLQKISGTPKISSLDPSCDKDKANLEVKIGSRVHKLDIQNTGSQKYTVKGTINRDSKEGKYKINYDADYNKDKQIISSVRSPELNLIGGKTYSPDDLEQIYKENEKANSDAALSGRPQAAIGESILIAQGYTPALVQYCGLNETLGAAPGAMKPDAAR